MRPPLVAGSTGPLAADHDVLLLDLDGVLYVGPEAVPGAADALSAARRHGARPAFVTNNAARTPDVVAAHLRELGMPATADEVVTSAQAVARLVAEAVPPGSAVLAVGGEGLWTALGEVGLRPVARAQDEPAAVAQGFGPEVGWPQLAEAAYAVRAGLPWFASNLDPTVPTPSGLAPGNGALVAAVAAATGARPVAAGKPEPPLLAEAVRRSGAQDPLVVGDRLDTDIEGADRLGAASLLVLTGVSGPQDLVRAAPGQRPTYVAADLAGGLLTAHPGVEAAEGGGRRCGSWTVRVDEGRVAVRGEGDRVEALRAVAVAAWDHAGDVDPSSLDAALHASGW